jgi:hypothetical protein
MPAKSVAQRRLFALAEHKPDELYAKDKSLTKLSHKTLHDFAATKEKGLVSRKTSRSTK